ncbi:hypothetical protein AZL_b02200 (plasmid) [Azospirillum sp. B510]|uniref:hypothetical protein n=1 Tax=Azospirillum sp. (strain B510) TaxID=137722 RepID=UPI0001C4CC1D|nr:hypothetical protein [Azospirillum sp. B510]BAI74883.1 hypothetical protein AZL_b02200 [Azospirillum sp. B510]
MATSYHSLTADRVKVGDRLPDLRIPVTATTIVLGASASRDWQPQHHDFAWAKRIGTRDIFLNAPTQGGWISRYITDWAGPIARLARMAYRMKISICPGDLMVLCGTVTKVDKDRTGCVWIDVTVEARVGETLCTSVAVTVSLPEAIGAESPWTRSADRWLVGELPPVTETK